MRSGRLPWLRSYLAGDRGASGRGAVGHVAPLLVTLNLFWVTVCVGGCSVIRHSDPVFFLPNIGEATECPEKGNP